MNADPDCADGTIRTRPLDGLGRLLRAACAVLLLLSGADRTAAESCPLLPRPVFAGHSISVDATPAPESIGLERAFPALEFSFPVGLESPDDGTDRIFVVEQAGRILVFENRDDATSASVFLDIRTSVNFGGERGLLGLAFDPDYATNRRFYVNYIGRTATCNDPDTVYCTKLVQYEASATDPEVADPASGVELLDFSQPYTNHNGGALAFGPDGMLYVATGDGGSAGDPHGHGQNRATLLGSILRLDVRPGAGSIVPVDNPFVDDPQSHPLVYHYGLRNPWRISFDRLTGDLLIADVGQAQREEVHRVRAGTPGGLNFGWNACEGTLDFDGTCSSLSSVPPVLEYPHDQPDGGQIIVGGYVYRGSGLPELFGRYLYADGASMNLWAWDGSDPVDPWSPGNGGDLLAHTGIELSSWGQDRAGELYALSIATGSVYRLARSSGSADFPLWLSETGLFSDVGALEPAPGLIEYSVGTELWSDGAVKRRWIALPGRERIRFHASDPWIFPIGTVLVKHFELPRPGGGSRRVSTRLFLRQRTGWVGMSYRWLDPPSDAARVTTGSIDPVDLGGGTTADWRFPSPNECLACHTSAAGRVLGVLTRQLQEPFDYPPRGAFPGGQMAQLEAWSCAGLFDIDVRDAARYPRGHALDDFAASRTNRFRTYMATNCEMCHQPQGTAPGELDFRFNRAIADWNALDVPVAQGDFSIPDARLIAPGDRTRSMVWFRQDLSDDASRMAPGTLTPHAEAVALVGDWIDFDATTPDSDEDGHPDATDRCPMTPDPPQADRDGDGLGDLCDPDDLPDLSVAAIGLSATGALKEGDSIVLTATVVNGGITDAGDFPVAFYLSGDTVFDQDDVPVDHCWIESIDAGGLNGCETTDAIVPIALPGNELAPAPYYLVACADAADVRLDADDANDCKVSSSSVLVPEPPIGWLQLWGAAALGLLGRRRRRPALRSSVPGRHGRPAPRS